MNKVILIAMVFVVIGVCDKMMMRVGLESTNVIADSVMQNLDAVSQLQKMLKDANMTCSNIISLQMIQLDYSFANFPAIDVAGEISINNGECKVEALLKLDANTYVVTFSKIIPDYPPFKKLAELTK